MMVKQISKYKGFTLVEILVVVALVAILAGIDLPAYQSQVLRGKRAEAKALLMDIVSRQERYYTQNSSYATSITDTNGLNTSDSSENDNYTATNTTSTASCRTTTSPY